MWVVDVFPEEVESILLDPHYDPNDVEEANGESDDEGLPDKAVLSDARRCTC